MFISIVIGLNYLKQSSNTTIWIGYLKLTGITKYMLERIWTRLTTNNRTKPAHNQITSWSDCCFVTICNNNIVHLINGPY